MTLAELHNDLYEVVDRIARGEGPVWIERNGTAIVIRSEQAPSRLARLQKPATKACIGDSDEVVGMSWANEWQRRAA